MDKKECLHDTINYHYYLNRIKNVEILIKKTCLDCGKDLKIHEKEKIRAMKRNANY